MMMKDSTTQTGEAKASIILIESNNQSPPTSPITISGYRTIRNPSLEVLIQAVIWILTATVILSLLIRT